MKAKTKIIHEVQLKPKELQAILRLVMAACDLHELGQDPIKPTETDKKVGYSYLTHHGVTPISVVRPKRFGHPPVD